MFCKVPVFTNYWKFTGRNLCRSLLKLQAYSMATLEGVYTWNFIPDETHSGMILSTVYTFSLRWNLTQGWNHLSQDERDKISPQDEKKRKREKTCKHFIPGLNMSMSMSLYIRWYFPFTISSVNGKTSFLLQCVFWIFDACNFNIIIVTRNFNKRLYDFIMILYR